LNVTTGVFEYAKVKNKENKPRKDILTDFQRFYGELNDNDFRKYGIIRDKRQKDILRRRNE
jgi:hypothetical protein